MFPPTCTWQHVVTEQLCMLTVFIVLLIGLHISGTESCLTPMHQMSQIDLSWYEVWATLSVVNRRVTSKKISGTSRRHIGLGTAQYIIGLNHVITLMATACERHMGTVESCQCENCRRLGLTWVNVCGMSNSIGGSPLVFADVNSAWPTIRHIHSV